MGREFQSQIQDNRTYVDVVSLKPMLNTDYYPLTEQHGRPLQVLDIGETAIDEDTFNEYLGEMRQVYTADKVSRNNLRPIVMLMSRFQYHLLGNYPSPSMT